MAVENAAERAWNKVKDDSDPEFAQLDGDAKARLNLAMGEVSQGRSSGIAGLEDFEAEVKNLVDVQSAPDVTVSVTDPSQPPVAEARGAGVGAEPQPKGTGAQKGGSKKASKSKALKDAAAAGARVEHDEVNSPSYPSAARPMGAEAPGNAPAEGEKSAKKSGARSKGAAAKKGASKSSASKTGGARKK